MMIREICYEELEAASIVIWKSFYEAEKNHTSMSGMELFRDMISPVSLSMNTYQDDVQLYGAFSDERLTAVGALKDSNKILMLYVHPEVWGEGIGSMLLSFLEDRALGDEIVLNSSDFALNFYKKKGYVKSAKKRIENELCFTPMKKIKK